MDRKNWAKIQKNWDFLRKELTAVYLLDDLKSCPDIILTDEDEQRVKYEPVDADKNERLLRILKHKPSSLNAYQWFLGIVKKYQKHIFDRLNKTEVDASDVQDEPSYDINSLVREILLKNFVDEAGKSCKLPDVRNAVCVLRGRGVNFDWKDDKLKDFVIEVFSGVVFEPGRKGKVFLHLGAKEEKVVVPKVADPHEVPTTTVSAVAVAAAAAASTGTGEDSDVGAPTHGTSNEPASHHKDIESLTVEELITYLTPIFMSLKLGEHFTEKFKELDIDGVVFLTMKEEDFKQEFSPKELSFGKRRKLMLKIKEMKEEKTEITKQDIKLPIHTTLTCETDKPEARVAAAPSVLTTQTTTEGNASQTTVAAATSEQTKLTRQGHTSARWIASGPYKEHFRRFDSPVSPTDRYTWGRMIEISGYSRENMINPVKKFLQLEKGEKNVYRKIAKETVMFASACMNDRTNGTLYVGINPLPSDLGQGQVVGIHLDREKCEDNIRQLIGEAFYEDQQDIAFQAVRSVKFIEVADPETPDRPLWVLEVDVVPSGNVVMEEAFFIRGKVVGAHKAKKQQLYRLIDGTINSLSEKDIYDFMKKKKSLTELRLQREIQSSPSYVPPDLRKKILNLFTGGSETIEDEIYPVLLISPLDTSMDHGYIEENLSFIQYFDTKAVFDFDPTSDSKGIYSANEKRQVYEVHTTDNFDKIAGGYSEKDLESLNFSTEKSWIFCNGYSRLRMEEMQPYDWKQKRFDGFKEALRFFHSSIPLGRGILLIFLFSKNYEVLLEAADEVILKFKDQWMVVAETEEIANLWKEQLIMRNVVSKKSLDNRCILGMRWRHVNSTFTQIISPKQTGVCELPTSTGAFCVLKDRIRIEMCDLEILSSKECEADDALNNAESRELLRRKVEEKFFRGSQVQWMNFWFRDNHVLKRLQHKDLIKEVEKSLENPNRDEDVRVNLVTLMHQPGAGGTTSSKQILWDLKEKYRCCVVRKITDETATQIAKLRSYDEPTTRKPPLILIDNEEKDKVHQLLFELEEKAKVASHYEDQTLNIFCAVLWCHRGVDIQRSDRTQILLKHELQRWELEWFQRKYETLERKFHEDRKVDPKLLISFNILKTNFDSDYIKRIVIEFMRQIDDTEESVLIRYLSLLNSYDVDFQTMPVSAFDPITEKQLRQKRILQFGVLERSGSRQKGWETKMSTSLRVLVNESSQRGVHGSHIKTIRITSPLLAKEILCYIQKENCLETSEIMIEFLSSVIFDYENGSTNQLLTIIKNVVKKRVTGKDGIGRFSPLILHIHETEGSEKAAEIFVEVHRKTHDPMIAQQIARYYIHTSNWTEAERYAGIATQNRPNSSFLWDTYGQVYKQQLFEYNERAKKGVKISNEDASVILQLAQKAMNIFRKEQILSETEKSFKTNNGGCFGELRVIVCLLETVCHFESFPGARDFHRYLVDKNFKTDAFSFLEKHEEEMMKSLGESAFKTIRKLEDESVQIKSDSREEFKLDQHFDRKSLIQLKESVSAHFGEVSAEVPGSLSDEDACEYRRRYARRMGVTSLQGALSLKYKNHVDWEDRLVRVYDLMKENVKAKTCTAFDLVTILNTVITLHIGESSKIAPIPYSKILEWSMKLYNAKQPDGRPYLETYLYLVLFHFPTESRKAQGCNTCSEVKLQEAVNRWKEAFFTNYPKHRDLEQFSRKKDTTLFFLGNGSGLTEIVYQKELMKRGGRMRDDEYWRSDQARRRFQRLEGTLLMSGQEVQLYLQLRGGTKFPLTIPTSKPTKKRTMCLKRVYCVLGFSWCGPKAYDITLDNPSSGSRGRAAVVPRSPVQQKPDTHTLTLEAEMTQVKGKLESLRRKKVLSNHECKQKADLEQKMKELTGARTNVLDSSKTDSK